MTLVAQVHHFVGVLQYLAMIWNSLKIRSCVDSRRYLRIWIGMVTGPEAFSSRCLVACGNVVPPCKVLV